MLAAFKLYVMPYLVYLGVFWAAGQGLFKKASTAAFMFLVLVQFPQLWYPTHELPLGSMSLTILTAAALIGGYRQRPKNDPRAPNHGFVLFFILSSYFALWISSIRYDLALPFTSSNDLFPEWRNYAMMLALYYVGYAAFRTETDIRRVVLLYCWVLLIMAQRELANFASGDSFSYNRRCVGSFYIVGLGANHFAAFIAHFSAIAIGLFAVDTHKWRRRLYLVTFIASLYPLFFSYSRGAYVAVLFALMVVGVIRYRSLLPLIGLFLLFWDSLLPSSVVDRIQMTEGADGQMEESAALRLVVWQLADRLFHENPFFGIGFQGFYYASAGLPLRNVHNYFLQTAAEQGIFGCILLAMFFIKAGWSGWRLYRIGSTPLFQGMGLGLIAALSAALITNLFGDRFSQLAVGSYLWLFFGMVDRAWIMSQQPANTAELPIPSGNPTVARAGT
ncbi:O-antigen ligase family protein [Aquabacterium sp.]|uniref:O-antigen ligase family protein n=1 Tax=Aquabacterium sp. TaxID=1872578 RepID=UPI002E324EF8|nr:O-antigen ligase family protein [Aquabacterium sp.]HEX5311191.1 O-antigen ligase family protein [Aquabacterium sp.]